MPFPSTPIPVQPADLGNPNTPVDPLQHNDQPFPSLRASPDRNGPPPFASAQNLNGVNVPPPPGITGVSGPQSIVGQQPIQIDTPHGSMNDGAEENPFKRSERWMPSVPTPSCEEWKTRAGEITGFLNWLTTLASWTGLGSNAYPSEIMMAIRESEPLGWHCLQPSQVTRSVRLLSILKLCFSNHARANLVIKNYEESKGYTRCCGFECLRLIAREFSVKTRTELLFFRTQLANSNNITAPTMPEVIRNSQPELF